MNDQENRINLYCFKRLGTLFFPQKTKHRCLIDTDIYTWNTIYTGSMVDFIIVRISETRAWQERGIQQYTTVRHATQLQISHGRTSDGCITSSTLLNRYVVTVALLTRMNIMEKSTRDAFPYWDTGKAKLGLGGRTTLDHGI